MEHFARRVRIDLPPRQSAFLWGARKTGMEMDFILANGEVSIEVKGTNRVDNRSHRPLKAFIDANALKKAVLVCNEPTGRIVGEIRILPIRAFLETLWAGDIIA